MAKKSESSNYINNQRREYSIYVMQSRAIPAVTDGLKAGGRRVLWMARDGKKHKSATLAGATMPIHPHGTPEDAINTLAAPYGNNIPLFKGDGAFGTLLNPKAYGASRYTAVTVSKFTEDVVFRDIEIVPMVENYDGTLMEPLHFLPLVPITLINPSEGIAVGYATNILPRALDDIIVSQIAVLKGAKKISDPMPKFAPTADAAINVEETDRGLAYYFKGELTVKDTSTATIVRLPYGQTHAKVISKLEDLLDKGILLDYTDRSKNIINIEMKFKRGWLKTVDEDDLYKVLGLTIRHVENPNMLDFTGKAIWSASPSEIIREFTNWRLQWYIKRYERLRDLLKLDLQRYYDIRTAIANNVSALSRTLNTRSELKDALQKMKIVHLDYIADLPIYRFTEEERIKNENRIKEAEKQLQEYEELLRSEDKRKKVYISELQEILTTYNKGGYA